MHLTLHFCSDVLQYISQMSPVTILLIASWSSYTAGELLDDTNPVDVLKGCIFLQLLTGIQHLEPDES